MPEEIGSTIKNLSNLKETISGDLKIYSGEYSIDNFSKDIVYVSVAWSGWGKVSAARTTARILSTKYRDKSIDILIFTGVAGAANSNLKQWDIIIPNKLIQHDMDARPLFNKNVIPSLKKAEINPLNSWLEWSLSTINESIIKDEYHFFGKVKTGLVATGDKFIADKSILKDLSSEHPGLQAVEMEGAAFAQVAFQEKIPWLVIRVISDEADHSAAQNFSDFLKEYEHYSWYLINSLLRNFLLAPWADKIN
tara:strand:+ start:1533 stop:2285 length:753 start_codon:yes stop_codon:yes gene_type:complete